MSVRDAAMVVSPGKVGLGDLAQVLAGAAVVLDPLYWPRVEATSAIVAQAAGADVPVYGINTGFGKLASKRIAPGQPRCCSVTSLCRIAAE